MKLTRIYVDLCVGAFRRQRHRLLNVRDASRICDRTPSDRGTHRIRDATFAASPAMVRYWRSLLVAAKDTHGRKLSKAVVSALSISLRWSPLRPRAVVETLRDLGASRLDDDIQSSPSPAQTGGYDSRRPCSGARRRNGRSQSIGALVPSWRSKRWITRWLPTNRPAVSS